MISLHNILSVAKYESRLLRRGWFFKIFTFLTLVPLCFLNYLWYQNNFEWSVNAIPSNIPYMNLLMMNVGQAIIAIFLASDFIKRDTKLDTSEVFFVKSMSNTEYVLGKTWGNLKMFLFINFAALVISFVYNFYTENVWYDWQSYIFYFCFISIPTLIYIIGLSYFLMIFLKNQAVVFALLLLYIALTLFYIGDSVYYLFDYIGFSLPLMKSDIVGFHNLEAIIVHRLIYVLLGFAFITFTIYKLPRLANNKKKSNYTLVFALVFMVSASSLIYKHVSGFLANQNLRKEYISINNKYAELDKILPESYFITLTQNPRTIEAETVINGKAQNKGKEFIYTLNPGLDLKSVSSETHNIEYSRDKQAIVIMFEKTLRRNENVNLKFSYQGKIDESYCYLDIEDEELAKTKSKFMFNVNKNYAFITPKYLLLTPESGWYPRQGITYSPENPDWQQSYFSRFKLEITPLDSLMAISQGKDTIIDGKYIFEPEELLQSATVVIGNYEKKSVRVEDIDYNLCVIKGHDYFTQFCDTLRDTIPFLLSDMKQDVERTRNLSYPFKRFSLVETPANFTVYPRLWTRAQETMQPEMCLFPERGYDLREANFNQEFKNHKKWSSWGGNKERSDNEIKYEIIRNFIRFFRQTDTASNWSMKAGGNYTVERSINPYCIYPQLFNFKINIYSTELSVANILVEQYIDPIKGSNRIRSMNGISSQEKANLQFQKYSFAEMIEDNKNKDIKNELIGLKSQELFMPGELMIGRDEFRDSVFAYIDKNKFKNVRFESMLRYLEDVSDWDFKTDYSLWLDSVNCPGFDISEPVVSYFPEEEEDIYETVFRIKNNSDNFALLCIEVREPQNKKTYDYFYIDAGNSVERVIITNNQPNSYEVNTNISTNIPSVISFRASSASKITDRAPRESDTYTIDEIETPGEIIVDNEDEGFSVSKNAPIGILASKILEESDDTGLEYVGYNPWRSPLKWSKTTAPRYYGRNVRSVHFLKSGKGECWAKWDLNIKEEGQYDLFYWVAGYDELRWGRGHGDMKYQFFVNSGDDDNQEEYSLDLKKNSQGWAFLGTFYVKEGVFSVKLTDKTKMRNIEADAVKLVKR